MTKKAIDYTHAVRTAENSVKEISDPKLKLIAFETILKDLISNNSNKNEDEQLTQLKKTPKYEGNKIKKQDTECDLKIKFAEVIKIGTDEVDLVFNINEDDISYSIVTDFQYNTGKWSQINFVLLSLLAEYIVNGKRKSYSHPILHSMKKYGFGELPNINAFMRSVSPQLVHVKTFKKKNENTYEITDKGIKATLALINEIVKANGIAPSTPGYLPQKISKTRPKSGLTIHIIDRINEGFFNTPKSIKELKEKLDEKGFCYERNIVDEKIRRKFLGNELRRIKISNKWHYVKNHT